MKELMEEMRTVARDEKPAPKDAAQPSIESADELARLIAPENRGRRDRKVGLTRVISKEMLEAVLLAKPPAEASAFNHEVK